MFTIILILIYINYFANMLYFYLTYMTILAARRHHLQNLFGVLFIPLLFPYFSFLFKIDFIAYQYFKIHVFHSAAKGFGWLIGPAIQCLVINLVFIWLVKIQKADLVSPAEINCIWPNRCSDRVSPSYDFLTDF